MLVCPVVADGGATATGMSANAHASIAATNGSLRKDVRDSSISILQKNRPNLCGVLIRESSPDRSMRKRPHRPAKARNISCRMRYRTFGEPTYVNAAFLARGGSKQINQSFNDIDSSVLIFTSLQPI